MTNPSGAEWQNGGGDCGDPLGQGWFLAAGPD